MKNGRTVVGFLPFGNVKSRERFVKDDVTSIYGLTSSFNGDLQSYSLLSSDASCVPGMELHLKGTEDTAEAIYLLHFQSMFTYIEVWNNGDLLLLTCIILLGKTRRR